MSDSEIKTEILIHDLKVPLSVIDAGAKSLLNRQQTYGPLTGKQEKVIRRIIRNTLTTQRLVNDILELGRSREGVINLTAFTVGSLVSTVLVDIFDLCNPSVAETVRQADSCDGLVRAVAACGFRVDVNGDVWDSAVHLDRPKVRIILRNLVSNAYKHRAEQVDISVSIRSRELVLVVRDDGKGIPASEHRKIFKSYFTTGGSVEDVINSHGLGLAGVMILLKDMGGSLTLDSDTGKGAVFTVVIPLIN